MAKDLLLPGSILSLHRSAVEKLLKAGNGDAALLYLCLTAGQNSGALPWGPDQVEAAQNTLLRLGLISSDTPVQPPRPEKLEEVAALVSRAGIRKPIRVVEGGASRAESVLLAALEASPDTEYLAVHDGARPLILPKQVDEMIRLGQRTYAVAPALPVTDTVKVADMAGLVLSTPDRSTLFAVQTPQVFQANILKAALQSALAAGAALTDDCSAVERLGKEVYLTPGWRENIKITTPEDLSVAEAFLRRRGDAQ